MVHGINPPYGDIKIYKCFSDNCSMKDKEWSRLDDFRLHINIMHQNQDPMSLINLYDALYHTFLIDY
jgi:hypothetical protein